MDNSINIYLFQKLKIKNTTRIKRKRKVVAQLDFVLGLNKRIMSVTDSWQGGLQDRLEGVGGEEDSTEPYRQAGRLSAGSRN